MPGTKQWPEITSFARHRLLSIACRWKWCWDSFLHCHIASIATFVAKWCWERFPLSSLVGSLPLSPCCLRAKKTSPWLIFLPRTSLSLCLLSTLSACSPSFNAYFPLKWMRKLFDFRGFSIYTVQQILLAQWNERQDSQTRCNLSRNWQHSPACTLPALLVWASGDLEHHVEACLSVPYQRLWSFFLY